MDIKLTMRLALIFLASITHSTLSFSDDKLSPYVGATGTIEFPTNFRTTMAHLGSWFVPSGDASGFHDVYTEKESIEFYRRNGVFPDGATLVKELRASKAGNYTTGQGVHHSTEGLKQWFVMIKDSQNRFAEDPLWGDGWGWALFKPDESNKNVASDYKTDCLGCHIPAKDNDWVYTDAYPILRLNERSD
jgi:hypothetical protein